MSKFSDLLNQPLPSQRVVKESEEDLLNMVQDEENILGDDELEEVCSKEEGCSKQEGCAKQEGCSKEEGCSKLEGCCSKEEGCSRPGIENTDLSQLDIDGDSDVDTDDIDELDGDDDFDPDDMDENQLAALDAELSDDIVDNVVPDEAEVSLTPEEEIQADDMMSMAATTMLVNDEMNANEKASFIENESHYAINEGFMTESDVNGLITNGVPITEAKYNNRMIIKLDAASKKKQLYALAVNVSAAAHHDPDWIKLKKVMKMRKILRAKLAKKYHSEASKRMKIYFARLRQSKSGALNNIGKKYGK